MTVLPPEEEARGLEITDDSELLVPESELGNVFMFTRMATLGAGIDDLVHLRSLLVYFEKSGDNQVDLREVRNGTAVASAEDRILASFVGSPQDGGFVIDFNEMPKVYAEFLPYTPWDPSAEQVLDISGSTILQMRHTGSYTTIDRAIELPAFGGATVAMKYGFTDYTADDTISPKPNNEVVGYYENQPVTEGDPTTGYAQRHSLESPLVYYVDFEMPEARVADVDTAATYWNGVFQAAQVDLTIELRTLPEDADPLDPDRNVIDWRPDVADGTGVGIMATDPLTGRITKATALVTSVFEGLVEQVVGTQLIRGAVANNETVTAPSDTVVARAISDEYVQIFAHEIGHTLGLRHNWMGNHGSTIDSSTDDVDQLLVYLDSDLGEGVLPTNSTMEYLETELNILVGAHIRLQRPPLAYDVEAIRSIYGTGSTELGLFCELESEPVFVDCASFDQGADPIQGTMRQWARRIDEQAIALVLAERAGTPPVSPGDFTLIVLDPLSRITAFYTEEAQYLELWKANNEEQGPYLAAVEALKQSSFGALTGPWADYPKEVVTGGLSDARVTELVGDMRLRVDTMAVALGVTVDAAELDAYFAAVETSALAAVGALNGRTYSALP